MTITPEKLRELVEGVGEKKYMNLLEAAKTGKKFRCHSWDKGHWMQWIGDHFIDSFGVPEEVMNRSSRYEFYVEPLVWEKEQVVAGVDMKMGFINVPKKFAGKKFKIRLEEVLE